MEKQAITAQKNKTQTETTIEDIFIRIEKDGAWTPVVKVKPVQLAEKIIDCIFFHNLKEVIRRDVRRGDVVTIEKTDGNIPQIIRVNKELRPSWSKPFTG